MANSSGSSTKAASLESFLAKIYVDENARKDFLGDPFGEAIRAGLSARDARALEQIDRTGLELAAASFARKKQKRDCRQRHK